MLYPQSTEYFFQQVIDAEGEENDNSVGSNKSGED
jgi:hypothetical protein